MRCVCPALCLCAFDNLFSLHFVVWHIFFICTGSLENHMQSQALSGRKAALQFLTVLFLSVVEVVREKGFHLDVEDYLAGVLIMASELVSLHQGRNGF